MFAGLVAGLRQRRASLSDGLDTEGVAVVDGAISRADCYRVRSEIDCLAQCGMLRPSSSKLAAGGGEHVVLGKVRFTRATSRSPPAVRSPHALAFVRAAAVAARSPPPTHPSRASVSSHWPPSATSATRRRAPP